MSAKVDSQAFDTAPLQTKPKKQVEALLPSAIAAYQRGLYDEARTLCRQILSDQPDIFDALHLLGVLELDGPRVAEAEQLLRHAVKVRPGSAEAHSNLGLACAKLKRFEDARKCHEAAVALDPNSPTALTNLGNALMNLQRYDACVEAHDRAIRLKPDYADAHVNRGMALLMSGRVAEADASFERALSLQPGHLAALMGKATSSMRLGHLDAAERALDTVFAIDPRVPNAFHYRGQVKMAQGKFDEAEADFNAALAIDPRSASAHANLGSLLTGLKRFEEAIASCDRAIALDSRLVDAHYNRGNALSELGRFSDAVVSFGKAIAIDPQHVGAYLGCGNAMVRAKQFTEAIRLYDRAIALKHDYAPAYINRAAALIELRRFDEAIQDSDRALAFVPGSTEAWINRGEALLQARRLNDALASYDRALELDEKSAAPWLGRANVHMLLRQLSEAKRACAEALAIEPMSAKGLVQLGQCHALQGDTDFAIACFDKVLSFEPGDEAALSNRIFALDFSPKADVASQQGARADWWRAIGSTEACRAATPHVRDRSPDRKLVVGYVSAEFKRRSAAYTYRPVLENHDRTQFEVVCYSNSPTSDDVTDSFRLLADRWHDAWQWSDDRLVECIERDRIDVLVDLSGQGEGNRLRVFARKPAPIQVTAWGNATGTGLLTIDYLFSDPVAIPSEVRHHYAEQIHDLPCLIALEPPPISRRVNLPPVSRNGFLTYGIFNRVSKFSDGAILLWSKLMLANPASMLIIKDLLLDDGATCSHLRDRFRANGVDPARISLRGSTDRDVHLAAYGEIDICLAPFPHAGGVSTWEALYMGVPVVTKLGEGPASRASGAILSAIGLADWVAADDNAYLEIARRATRTQLEALRRDLPSLIDQRCGPRSYTKAVEDAYRDMWRRYCRASAG